MPCSRNRDTGRIAIGAGGNVLGGANQNEPWTGRRAAASGARRGKPASEKLAPEPQPLLIDPVPDAL
jgi:hypothetical protein